MRTWRRTRPDTWTRCSPPTPGTCATCATRATRAARAIVCVLYDADVVFLCIFVFFLLLYRCHYHQNIVINLDEIEPLLNGPFSPDVATPLSQFPARAKKEAWPLELSAALIGSCTNSSYQDMQRAASLARQAHEAGLKTKVCSKHMFQTDVFVFRTRVPRSFSLFFGFAPRLFVL